MERILSKEDIKDLLLGATILGCGGGGDLTKGEELIEVAYKKGKTLKMASIEDLGAESLVSIVGMVGGGISEEEMKLVHGLEKTVRDPILTAAKELSKYIDKDFTGYIPCEIGPENTIHAMYVAAMEDKFFLDGDTGGRAKPEMSISTTNVMDIPLSPLSIVSDFGDIIFLKKSLNQRGEDITRFVCRASGGICGVARCPMTKEQLQRGIVQNSISSTIEIGRTIRENEGETIHEAIKDLKAIELFEGKVSGFTREEKYGFMWGEIHITGSNEFEGEAYKVWYKNEHLISWRNGRVDAMCPDSMKSDVHFCTRLCKLRLQIH
jgi:hypothetical protein